MLGTDNAAERSRWETLWVKDGKIHRFPKDGGTNDLSACIDVYMKVKGKRPGATLRCCNFGFPPPPEYLPHTKKMKKKLDSPQIIKRGGKRYRKNYEVVEVIFDPMKEKNKEGIYWCPYCREFRRFKLRNQSRVGSIRIQDRAFVCPMCKVTHRDYNVRKYNPVAIQVYYELEQTQRRASPRDRKKEFIKKKRRRERSD